MPSPQLGLPPALTVLSLGSSLLKGAPYTHRLSQAWLPWDSEGRGEEKRYGNRRVRLEGPGASVSTSVQKQGGRGPRRLSVGSHTPSGPGQASDTAVH